MRSDLKLNFGIFFITLTGRAHEHVPGHLALSESAEHPLPAWFIQSGALGTAPGRFNTQTVPGQLGRGVSPLNRSNLELSPMVDFSMTVGSKPSCFQPQLRPG